MSGVNAPNREGDSRAQIKAERAVARALAKTPDAQAVNRPLGVDGRSPRIRGYTAVRRQDYTNTR